MASQSPSCSVVASTPAFRQAESRFVRASALRRPAGVLERAVQLPRSGTAIAPGPAPVVQAGPGATRITSISKTTR